MALCTAFSAASVDIAVHSATWRIPIPAPNRKARTVRSRADNLSRADLTSPAARRLMAISSGCGFALGGSVPRRRTRRSRRIRDREKSFEVLITIRHSHDSKSPASGRYVRSPRMALIRASCAMSSASLRSRATRLANRATRGAQRRQSSSGVLGTSPAASVPDSGNSMLNIRRLEYVRTARNRTPSPVLGEDQSGGVGRPSVREHAEIERFRVREVAGP